MKKIKIISSLLGVLICGFAYASPENPEANFDYKIINNSSNSAPTSSTLDANKKATKVEVAEFFSFACSHCYAFDPTLTSWVEKNKANIIFKRIPVGFNKTYEGYQKLFYALESIGKLEQLHTKVFDAIHKDNNPLKTTEDITKFAKSNNIDAKKLLANYNSFSIATKAKLANNFADKYKIDGVPTVMIGGKYITSGQMVGGRDEVLKVMDFLVKKSK